MARAGSLTINNQSNRHANCLGIPFAGIPAVEDHGKAAKVGDARKDQTAAHEYDNPNETRVQQNRQHAGDEDDETIANPSFSFARQ
jgi:hypothetical protein